MDAVLAKIQEVFAMFIDFFKNIFGLFVAQPVPELTEPTE